MSSSTLPEPSHDVRNVRVLRTEADHRWALEEVSRYFENQPEMGSPDGDRFEILVTLITAYENEHYPVAPADPVDMLHFAIEDMGRSQAELAQLLGSRARASEILNRKRHLTLDQIRRISAAWQLPIEVLAAPYRLERDAA